MRGWIGDNTLAASIIALEGSWPYIRDRIRPESNGSTLKAFSVISELLPQRVEGLIDILAPVLYVVGPSVMNQGVVGPEALVVAWK